MDGNPSSCSLVSIPTKHGWEYQTIRCNCSSNLTSVPFCPRDRTVACDTSVNAQRVPIQSVCDGATDCRNGADELRCSAVLRVAESGTCGVAKDFGGNPCVSEGNITIYQGLAVMQRHSALGGCPPLILVMGALNRATGLVGFSLCNLSRNNGTCRLFYHHACSLL